MRGISGSCLSCWRGDEGEAWSTNTSCRLSLVSWFAAGFWLFPQPLCPGGTDPAGHHRLCGGDRAGWQRLQRELPCFSIDPGSEGHTHKIRLPAQSGVNKLVPQERWQSLAGEGHCSPTWNDGWCSPPPPPPQTTFNRPATTTFPHKPHVTRGLRLPRPQHHRCTHKPGASACGRGCRG